MKLKILCILPLLGAVVDTALLLYLLDTDTGLALSCDSTRSTCGFVDQIYGNSSQLWKFTKDGDLISEKDSKYLGFDHTSKNIQFSSTSDITWYWEGGKIKAQDQSPAQIVCISETASQVVDCDNGANITLHVYEEEIYNLIQDINKLIDNTTDQMNANISNITDTTAAIATAINNTLVKLDEWDVSMGEYSDNYTAQTNGIRDKMILAKGHLELDIKENTDKMIMLEAAVVNATTHINKTNYNFTLLESDLLDYQNNTNITVRRHVAQLHEELDKKSTIGHIIPDNIYEFAVLFLFALGVVNMCDITRRLIKYAINPPLDVQYGTE